MNGEVEEIYSPARFPDDGTVRRCARAVGGRYGHYHANISAVFRNFSMIMKGSRRYETLPDGKLEINGRHATARAHARIFR